LKKIREFGIRKILKMIDEAFISRAITESYFTDLLNFIEADVIIRGAGHSGLCACYYLAKNGIKTLIFESALKIGGGMPGGGIMFTPHIFCTLFIIEPKTS